jgi:hypothetical protein
MGSVILNWGRTFTRWRGSFYHIDMTAKVDEGLEASRRDGGQDHGHGRGKSRCACLDFTGTCCFPTPYMSDEIMN